MSINDVRRIERDGKILLEMPEDYFWALVENLQFWTVRMTLTLPIEKLDQLHAPEHDLNPSLQARRSQMDEESKITGIARTEAFEEMRFPLQKPE